MQGSSNKGQENPGTSRSGGEHQPTGKLKTALMAVFVGLMVIGLCVALGLAWFFDAKDPAFGAEPDQVTMLSFEGAYSVDGGAWLPYEGPTFEANLIGVQSIVVKGHLLSAVPEGERINLRLSSTSCTFRVNGEEVFFFDGRSGKGPASEPLLGWVGFSSPGITLNDEVEIELRSISAYSSAGDYELTFRTFCAGAADSLREAMVTLFAPMFICGLLVLIAGFLLALIATVGHLIGVPKERGSLLFATYVLIGGLWIFFCFDYITLFIPRPQFTATVSLLAQDMLGIVLMAFVACRSQGRLRRCALGSVALLAGAVAFAVVLRIAGVCSLFNANILLVPLFEITMLSVAIAFARTALVKHDRDMQEAAAVVLPCALGAFLEGLSFLIWGVSTGFALAAGIAVSVCLRFVALYAHARKQVALEERAIRAEQELVHSRIAITISQIQPHFLYNALTAIRYLCTENPPVAAQAVCDFSRYLRGNMDSLSTKEPIAFEQELDHLRHYVAIEQLRFPDIEIVFDLEELDFNMPALTVQPLVENAICHGVRGREEGGKVTVSSCSDATGFYVRVKDDGVGFSEPLSIEDVCSDLVLENDSTRKHVGLENVAFRIKSLCNGTVSLQSTPGEGCCVTISLPRSSE